jgi:AcrR family transcriptional regulator
MAGVSKGERTRQALLETAVRRFAADGYRVASVSAIAREVGLTPAAAYAYFENKEELFQAAVDLDAVSLIQEAQAGVAAQAGAAGASTPRERLLGMVAHLMEGLDHHPLARRVLEGREPDVSGRMLGLPALRALRAAVAEDLQAGQSAGTVRSDIEPDTMALGLETVVLAILMAHLQIAGSAPDAESRAQALFELLDASLRPAPGNTGGPERERFERPGNG